MMHVTYDGKSVLMHDDPAALLLEYAAELGSSHSADVVNIKAVNLDGNVLTIGYLLNDSSELTAESTTSGLDVPPDEEAVAYMRDRIEALRNPPTSQPYTADEPGPGYDD